MALVAHQERRVRLVGAPDRKLAAEIGATLQQRLVVMPARVRLAPCGALWQQRLARDKQGDGNNG